MSANSFLIILTLTLLKQASASRYLRLLITFSSFRLKEFLISWGIWSKNSWANWSASLHICIGSGADTWKLCNGNTRLYRPSYEILPLILVSANRLIVICQFSHSVRKILAKYNTNNLSLAIHNSTLPQLSTFSSSLKADSCFSNFSGGQKSSSSRTATKSPCKRYKALL